MCESPLARFSVIWVFFTSAFGSRARARRTKCTDHVISTSETLLITPPLRVTSGKCSTVLSMTGSTLIPSNERTLNDNQHYFLHSNAYISPRLPKLTLTLFILVRTNLRWVGWPPSTYKITLYFSPFSIPRCRTFSSPKLFCDYSIQHHLYSL